MFSKPLSKYLHKQEGLGINRLWNQDFRKCRLTFWCFAGASPSGYSPRAGWGGAGRKQASWMVPRVT